MVNLYKNLLFSTLAISISICIITPNAVSKEVTAKGRISWEKLSLETRKLDIEERKLDLEIIKIELAACDSLYEGQLAEKNACIRRVIKKINSKT